MISSIGFSKSISKSSYLMSNAEPLLLLRRPTSMVSGHDDTFRDWG